MLISLIFVGIYLLCGLIWYQYNRKKPAIYQITAPASVVLLFWPLGFYYLQLRAYWHPERYSVHLSKEHPGPGDRLRDEVHRFPSWTKALAHARQLAAASNETVAIFDLARFDKNLLGDLWQRMYSVNPAGDVFLSSTFPGRLVESFSEGPRKGLVSRVVRDTGIVVGLTFSGSLLVLLAGADPANPVPFAIATWIMGTIGFTIIARKASYPRFKQVALVVIAVWMVHLPMALAVKASPATWAATLGQVILMALIGTTISYYIFNHRTES